MPKPVRLKAWMRLTYPGTYESMNFAIGQYLSSKLAKNFIKAVKDSVNIPVIAVSKLREPSVIEELLQEGVVDFAALGRPLLADPDFANKAIRGEDESIRKCISCLFCFEELLKGSHVVCAVNPLTGFEAKYPERGKTDKPKKVVIVGAGPAGLSAAKRL